METDDERVALAERWCPQVPGRTEQQLGKFVVVEVFPGEIDLDNFLALGDVEVTDTVKQFEGVLAPLTLLRGVELFSGLDCRVRKILLRLPAARSARAVVHPVDSCHRRLLFDALVVPSAWWGSG